jgi:protein-disulfide isomerase
MTHLPRALRSASAGLLGLALAATATLAQGVSAAPVAAPLDLLMEPGLLPDIVQGSQSAPVTIIEYASLTCSHCAAFHEETWPGLKTRYVDTGKVKFVLREFPLDPLAAAGFMLARCLGPARRDAFVDQLFAQRKSWAFVAEPVEPLLALVKLAGMSQTDFQACLGNRELYDRVNKSRDRAAAAFDIESTPTFFINGRKLTGEPALADFDKLLAPLLK